ncbi:hypothetical protein ACA910_012955 [Epithemia clementina (nom. ined.)]
MPFCHSRSHNFQTQHQHHHHHQPREDYSDWIFPTNVCSSYSSLGTLLRASMTNSALPEESAVDDLDQQVLPDTKEYASPTHYRTASPAEDSDEVVVVQPSFDDNGAIRTSGSSSPLDRTRERQSRSPVGDAKEDDVEEPRNPSSPDRREKGNPCHTRNLSALFDATSISDDVVGDEQIDADYTSRKHRRIFSGDVTNPNYAHRRLNSVGNVAPVSRRHHREGSEGLDILSAAANATKEEVTAVAGNEEARPTWEPGQHPRSSLGQVSSSSSSYSPQLARSYEHPPTRSAQQQHQMEPPPQRQRGHHPPIPHTQTLPAYVPRYPPGTAAASYHHYPVHSHPSSPYYGHLYAGKGPILHFPPPHYSHQEPEYYKGSEFGGVRATQPRDVEAARYSQTVPPSSEWEPRSSNTTAVDSVAPSSSHQGVQTFVTAIAVGKGNRVVPTSTKVKNTGTNTEPAHPSLPAEIGHHRKMSSFSSLGTILGSSLFTGSSGNGASDSDAIKKKGHHRASSSSVSFLNVLEVGLDDANFLRNLQASNASGSYRSSPPPTKPRRQQAEVLPRSPIQAPPDDESDEDSPPESTGGIKLATGGTSKRVRRKCTAPGCTNRVVQGGLCISHGAKRKICNHPGCNKNVKKAGLCSTHGPARKRCEHPDCPKVAVQGGRCIAHGAKKKLCSVENCAKQAILSGMCKKHHDQTQQGRKSGSDSEECCQPAAASHKPTHTRGLSIFQEMSADAVSSLLNDPNAPSKAAAPPASASSW